MGNNGGNSQGLHAGRGASIPAPHLLLPAGSPHSIPTGIACVSLFRCSLWCRVIRVGRMGSPVLPGVEEQGWPPSR